MSWTHREPCGQIRNGRPCGRDDETVRPYLVGWRCPECTPAAMAGKPEPGAGACPLPRRVHTPATETVIDQRAVATGKRRSSVTRYREAQEATR